MLLYNSRSTFMQLKGRFDRSPIGIGRPSLQRAERNVISLDLDLRSPAHCRYDQQGKTRRDTWPAFSHSIDANRDRLGKKPYSRGSCDHIVSGCASSSGIAILAWRPDLERLRCLSSP